MLPDRVSNPGPLTYESGALPIALRGPAHAYQMDPVDSFLFYLNQTSCSSGILHLRKKRKDILHSVC